MSLRRWLPELQKILPCDSKGLTYLVEVFPNKSGSRLLDQPVQLPRVNSVFLGCLGDAQFLLSDKPLNSPRDHDMKRLSFCRLFRFAVLWFGCCAAHSSGIIARVDS